MIRKQKLLVLEGDGIGPEVMVQAQRVLEWLAAEAGLDFDIEFRRAGGTSIDADGTPLSDETFERAMMADAIFLGAVGGPKWDDLTLKDRPEQALGRLRVGLDLCANLRPVKYLEPLSDCSPLKEERIRGLDLLIVRELTGGIYFSQPRGFGKTSEGEEEAFNTMRYRASQIESAARSAFVLAATRQGRVCLVDKANAIETSQLWRRVVTALQRDVFPNIELSFMYVDNCAMQLIRDPRQFDVILTENMFGDILSDEAAMLVGSLGLLPSASLGPLREEGRRHALYEPVHGSAPDIAGRQQANPIAAILCVAMACRYSFDRPAVADLIERAVFQALEQGTRTADVTIAGGRPSSTVEMGDAVLASLTELKTAESAELRGLAL